MSDPARTTVLLGAGASVEAGMPMASQLTDKIVDRVNAFRGPASNDVAWALNAAVGASTGAPDPEPAAGQRAG